MSNPVSYVHNYDMGTEPNLYLTLQIYENTLKGLKKCDMGKFCYDIYRDMVLKIIGHACKRSACVIMRNQSKDFIGRSMK